MRSEQCGGVSASDEAVSGNHLPNPLPPRVRRHSFTAQPSQSACGNGGSMPDTAPYGNAGCVVHPGRRGRGDAPWTLSLDTHDRTRPARPKASPAPRSRSSHGAIGRLRFAPDPGEGAVSGGQRAHRSSPPPGWCAGCMTGIRAHNRCFSANFAQPPVSWRFGRPTHVPAGRNRPRGTL